jgi:assimilatory nitrate reductase catalytic subunit
MSDPSITRTEPNYIISETPHQRLLRTGVAVPLFLQGVFPFVGHGAVRLTRLNDALTYLVPKDKRAEVIYFRAGNFTDELLYLTLSANGRPIRYFPIGPKGEFHVPLAIVEGHPEGTLLEICLAAPRDLTGTVVIDVGLLELDASQ